MDNSFINSNSDEFNKQSMQKRMESIGLSSFYVYEGSSNSVMLCEFYDFSKECIKHKTSIPFFEIFDIRSRSAYTHFINGETVKRNANSSGISFYTSQMEYGLEIESGSTINCDLLGINPVFFNDKLGDYQLGNILPEYVKDIQDKEIQNLVNSIASLYKNFLLPQIPPLLIEQQSIRLLGLITEKYLCLPSEFRFSKQQAKDIREYIDEKVKINEEINLEVLIDQFPIELPMCWVRVFIDEFKSTPYKYYMSRKLDIFSKLRERQDDKGMLICNQRKLFNLIHELVENPNLLKSHKSNKNNLIDFLSEELRYKKGTLHNHCKKLGLRPLNYYQFLRVEKAKQLLTTSFKDVAQISDECGFRDISDLRRCFQNRVNKMSPEEFRYEYKQTPIYF